MTRTISAIAISLLLAACADSPPPPPAAAAPPPAPQSFMVFFDFDKSTLNSNAQNVVRQAAAAAKSAARPVSATGHADRSGPDNYNMALSLRRANTVKDALVREGVPATAVSVSGLGESRPLVATADGVMEPQNRRVEIAFAGATATTNDQAYCTAMSQLYRRYISTSSADSEAGTAMAKCAAGNAAEAIPVLERLLRDAKIALPART